MSKELPYFRFTVAEWLNDDISDEPFNVQGVFISICAYYWFKDCSIDEAMLKKRFRDALAEVDVLLEEGIIKRDKDGFISIKFLDEQFDILSEKRKKRVEAGRKGGNARSSNAKAMLKQSPSYKDKDKEKDKDKDKKPRTKFVRPTIQEVASYFTENGYTKESGEKAFHYYNDAEWIDAKGSKVLNWKQKMRGVWFKDENKKTNQAPVSSNGLSGGYTF